MLMERTIKDSTGEVNTNLYHIEYRENADRSLDVFVFRKSIKGYSVPLGFVLGYSSLHYDPKR